jgi:DNA-binding transcriptional regulator YhcF (GntR family)
VAVWHGVTELTGLTMRDLGSSGSRSPTTSRRTSIAVRFLPTSRLPSEQALGDEVYGVARATVRRAIASLVEQGLVVVVHGRGTFVTAEPR